MDWYSEAKNIEEPEKAEQPDWYSSVLAQLKQDQTEGLSPVDAAIVSGQEVQPGSAGIGANLKAGLAEDTETDIDIFAKSIFPNLPIEDARERFTVVDGDIVYIDNEGQLKRPDSGFAAGASQFAANAGPSIAGGIAGGIAGTPLVGGALGAAAGEGAKNILRQAVFGEEQTTGEFAADVVTEFGVDLTFGKLFDVIGKGFRTRALRNLDRIDDTQISQMQKEIFERTGIKMDLAQITGIGQLRQLKTFISKNPGAAQDMVRAFDDLQKGQIETAVERIIKTVSRTDAALEALGTRGINAATAAIQVAKKTRTDATRPLYKEAFQSGQQVDPTSIITQLDEEIKAAKGPVKKALIAARDMLFEDPRTITEAVNGKEITRTVRDIDRSLEGLHGAKIAIDAMIEGAKGSDLAVSSFTRGKLIEANQMLTKILEDGSPAYARAQKTYRELTESVVKPLEDSVVGVIAKVKNKDAAKVSARLFSGNVIQSPENMRMARLAIKQVEKNNPELAGAWDGMIAQYLKNSSNRAMQSTMTGDAASLANRFRRQIAGTPRDRAVLREAFGGGVEGASRMKAFDDVMGALDMVAKTPLNASDTQGFQAILESLTNGIQKAGLFVVSPLQSIQRVLTETSVERSLVQAAEALMDPSKARAIQALRSMRPSFERNLIIAGIITGSVAIDSIEGVLSE